MSIRRIGAAITVIEGLFSKACRCIPDQSQPLPTLSIRPTLAEAGRTGKRPGRGEDVPPIAWL